MSKVNITSPVGRLVAGSLYKPSTTDKAGNPLIIKNGQNKGQATQRFWFNIAITKGSEQTWNQTEWGKQIWSVGQQAFPTMVNHPNFSWKIVDGDSNMPGEPGAKAPADNEGYKGNWIIKLSSSFAPKIYQQGSGGDWVQVLTENFIKPGYFIQVSFSVDRNDGEKPGVYINHNMVAFRAYGEEIQFGVNPNDVGFGSAPLPSGASVTPTSVSLPAVPAVPVVPVVPRPEFAEIGKPVKIMTPAAGGLTYEQYIQAGWNDTQLIASGFLVA